jgi:hypothetical protein
MLVERHGVVFLWLHALGLYGQLIPDGGRARRTRGSTAAAARPPLPPRWIPGITPDGGGQDIASGEFD